MEVAQQQCLWGLIPLFDIHRLDLRKSQAYSCQLFALVASLGAMGSQASVVRVRCTASVEARFNLITFLYHEEFPLITADFVSQVLSDHN